MLKKLLSIKYRILISIGLVILLALIRAYEDTLFYDPFLDYFKSEYNRNLLPEIDAMRLLIGLLWRYALNSIVSLAIIFTLFRQWSMIRFATVLYMIFFILLIVAFFAVVAFNEENKMLLFYIRRFLIQPLFLLLFIPAFYYQQRTV